jgi:hypothetical protein
MRAHARIEELIVSSLDASLTVEQQDTLHEHLGECAECRNLARAYRADASRLHAIAFEPAPAWIRFAIFDRRVRARHPRTRWVAVAAVVVLLTALLGLAGGAVLRASLSVTPLGEIDWLTPAEARMLVGAAAVEDGWLLAVADESQTTTKLRVYSPDGGWTADREFDEFAADAGVVIQVGPYSADLNTFAFSTDHGVLLTRDRSGGWARFDLPGARMIVDLAVTRSDVWVLGQTAAVRDPDDSGLIVLPSGTRFAPIGGPPEVRVLDARLAAAADRRVIAGCSTLGPAACDLVIHSGSNDRRGWTKASLPRKVDLRTPLVDSLASLIQRPTLRTQLAGRVDGFVTIVPTDVGGTEIWGSPDGSQWRVEATFASGPYPVGLVSDGNSVVAVGGGPGELWVWVSTDQEPWVGHRVELGADRPAGLVVARDRMYALAIGETTVEAWQLDLRR